MCFSSRRMNSQPAHTWLGTAAGAMAVVVVLACTGCTSSGGSAPASATSTQTLTVAAGPPVPSSGCDIPQSGPVTNQQENITVDGSPRWYLLDTPSPTTPSPTAAVAPSSTKAGTPIPRPMVVDFHGLGEGAVLHSATTRFGELGQKDGFVAVFPSGTGSPVQWDVSPTDTANPDLEFVTALLNQVESTQCIDTSRVYASGLSDGSFMVSFLACTMSNRFTAVAAVSGLQLPHPCHTTRRVPVLAFHGTADPILHFDGTVGTQNLQRLLGGGAGNPRRRPPRR